MERRDRGPRLVSRVPCVSGRRLPVLHIPRAAARRPRNRAMGSDQGRGHRILLGDRRRLEPPSRNWGGPRTVLVPGHRRGRHRRLAGPETGARSGRHHEPGDPRDGIAVTEFSARTRAANLERMRNELFDVLVVGGGIVGAGVARDTACRGFATALVDRGDFASGTSGKTSRLVHGGLRYLRNYRFGLVRRAVRERDLLLRNAPGLVHPLPFLIPAYADHGPRRGLLRFGLFLYDFLSKEKTLPRRTWLTPKEAREREPQIAEHGLTGAGLYYDAWTDDARLVLAIVQDAAAAGAIVANYVPFEGLVRNGDRVGGAHLRDAIGGGAFTVSSRSVVNATGVWLDRVRSTGTRPTIRPTKGVHIFLPRAKIGNRQALALSAKKDGRVVFVLPWGDLALVGTTDTDFRGDPDRVHPDPGDVAYLLETVNESFPAAHLGPDDVVSAYAGLRPLLRRGHEKAESDISRDHAIFEDHDGLISVTGGKLTTHRAMAEEVGGLLAHRLGRPQAIVTRDRLLGPPMRPLEEFTDLGFDEETALHLQGRYAAEQVQRHLGAPSATERLVPARPHTWVEVEIAVHEEMAMTLGDVLVRRLGLFYETPDQGMHVAGAVAERIGGILGWDSTRTGREIRAYEDLVRAHQGFRVDHGG